MKKNVNSEIVVNQTSHEAELTVNSTDPNERKLARRNRIRRRLEAAEKLKAISDGTYVEPEPEKPLIDETIETCEDTLRELLFEGNELITNIQLASDAREVKRRETETEEKNLRLQRLKEESAFALEKLDEISKKWETILEINGPLELYEHMKEQKARCLGLIEQKNDLIKSFQTELKLADEKFMKDQKTMYDELELLTKRIDEQVLLMKKAYRIEMTHIEDSVDLTRNQLTESHMKAWNNLFNQREKGELANMTRKFEMVKNYHEEVAKLHTNHEEKYRETKIQLETDIQTLEQELEQIKALCLLNSEKLDYNYQVLKKREEENVYIKNHQKRRLNKLQDMVNSLKKKIEDKRNATEEERKKLTKDVRRYHANVLDTDKKGDRFSQVNDDKFQNIWDMKEEEVKDLVNKILAADMIIHEQILGKSWVSPSKRTIHKSEMPSYNIALSAVSATRPPNRKTQDKHRDFKDSDAKPEIVAGRKRILRHILELIADRSGFLMEEKLDKLLEPYTDDEKTFVRLDNVFMAIGIRTESDVDMMKKIFMPYTICLICDKSEVSALNIEFQSELYEMYPLGQISSKQQLAVSTGDSEERDSKSRGMKGETGENNTSESSAKRDEESTSMRPDSFSDRLDTMDSMTSKRERVVSTRPSHDAVSHKSSTNKDAKRCDISHPIFMEKCYVLKALKDFVSAFHADKFGIMMGVEFKLSRQRYTVSRLLSTDDITTYWNKYKEILPPNLEDVWRAVFVGLNKYLEVLQERHILNLKAKNLRRQNLELKRLLTHYRPSKNEGVLLPYISSVPNEPIDPAELTEIVRKFGY